MAMTNHKNKFQKGFGLIEILVVIFLVVVGMASLLGFTTLSLKISSLNKQTAQANSLAMETIEAVRNFRDGTDWSVDGLGFLNIDTNYHLQQTLDIPSKWQFVTGEESINGFTRKVVLGQVLRDPASDNIATSGDVDPKTKKVTVTVSWADKNVELITYLTNWK